MKNTFIFILGLLFGLASLYAYIHTEAKKNHYKAPQIANMDFSALDIRSLRSNEKGIVEAHLTAKELKHYIKPAHYEVTDITSRWKDDPYVINMRARTATVEDNTSQKAILSGNVILKRYIPTDSDNKNTMTLTTDNLTALPTEKTVYTQAPTHITGPNMDVNSKYGLLANFNTGSYKFYQARMNYAPTNKAQ